uniref:Neurotransmitter-gated ion-channel ligand-binding domain-containing protein n=1 Tax=Plectus sambesii TaxID=2011161 RepID=A0A914XGA1_9BILA
MLSLLLSRPAAAAKVKCFQCTNRNQQCYESFSCEGDYCVSQYSVRNNELYYTKYCENAAPDGIPVKLGCKGSAEKAQETCYCNDKHFYVLKTYDKLFSPEQKPLKAGVTVWIEDMAELNDKNNLQMRAYVTVQWLDERLAFYNLNPCRENISIPDPTIIWTPDFGFIDNENEIALALQLLPAINSFVSVSEFGQLRLHQRVAVRAPCIFDLHRYPFDEVRCKLTFASFRMNNEKVILNWKDSGLMVDVKEDRLDGLKIVNISASKNIVKYPAEAGSWTELSINFKLKRNIGFVIWHSYVPAMLCVFVAGVTFFLGQKSTIARVILAGISLVALIFLVKSTSIYSAGAVYLRTFDYYLIVCTLLVCCALIEVVIVNNSCTPGANYEVQKSSDGFEQLVSYSSPGNNADFCNRHCGMLDMSMGCIYILCFVGWNVFYFIFFAMS